MARKLPLHPHLPVTELSHRARHAPTLVEARRWQLLALIADDKTVKDAAALVGLNVYYARRVVRRYNRDGPSSLRDHRLEQQPPPPSPLLTAEQQQELAEAVQGPSPGGGLWTGPDVARWIAAKTGRDVVAPQRGHDYLRRIGMSPQRPRPRHTEADPAAQEAFKKKSGQRGDGDPAGVPGSNGAAVGDR
jgi:transposase